MGQIDFVLPWVDDSDKDWQERRLRYSCKAGEQSNSDARFRDMGTLKYCLRAIEKNCPWYNKIYLITEGHIPEWLDTNNPKIIIITHKELYFDKSHLPTFNSSSIEMNLSNIKTLSEKFIYLNDDFLIIRPVREDRFFKKGKPVDFISHGWVPRNCLFELIKNRDSWVHSLNNTINLINKTLPAKNLEKRSLYDKSYNIRTKISNFLLKNIYKKVLWLEHWHHPQALLKSNVDNVFLEFKEQMLTSSENKFRSNSDLNQYIYRYYHLLKNNFYPQKNNDSLIANLESLEVLNSLIKKSKNPKVKFICFNDSNNLSKEDFYVIKLNLINFLEETLSEKASFEVSEG